MKCEMWRRANLILLGLLKIKDTNCKTFKYSNKNFATQYELCFPALQLKLQFIEIS